MMKGLKLTVCILLCVCVVVLNSPQSAQAVLFTKNAEAAIVAKDAEATEMAYVAPQSNAGTTFFSTGTGFTSIGNDLFGRLQQVFQPTPVEQIVLPSAIAVIDEQTAGDQTGITVVPLGADKATMAGAPVVLMGEGKAALTIEDMIPVVPAEGIVMSPQAPVADSATEEEKEKALFPLLWNGSGTAAAGAGAGAEAGAVAGAGLFSSTGAKVIGIGLLLAAVTLGIVLPLALSSGGGGNGDANTNGNGGGIDTGGGGDTDNGGGDGGGDGDGGDQGGSAPIPEPLTLILFGTGLIGLFLRRRND